MAGCGEESHMERRCRPAVMEGEAVMPAPAAVKGSVHGPLRALERGSRYGRRILWLAAQNWCKYTVIGGRFFRHYRFGKGLSYMRQSVPLRPAWPS